MPWPWEMSEWLYDPVASSLTGGTKIKRPYPKDHDWIEDRRWNQFPIHAMESVRTAAVIFNKKVDDWTKYDSVWYENYQASLLDGRESST